MRINELGGHSMLVSDEEKRKGHGQAERRHHQRALCRPRGPGAEDTSSQDGLQWWPHGALEGGATEEDDTDRPGFLPVGGQG